MNSLCKSIATIAALSLIIIALHVTSFGQKTEKLKSNEYWLLVNVPRDSTCPLKISATGIIADQQSCRYFKGARPDFSPFTVMVTPGAFQDGFVRLNVKFDENDSADLYFKSDSSKIPRNLFKTIFSKKKTKSAPYFFCADGASPFKLFKSRGFPSKVTTNEKEMVYEYGPEFFRTCGFDVAYITLQNGKVVKIEGLI